ncbi:MAG: RNA polymerase sigma factor [Pseudomonadota bacterium]
MDCVRLADTYQRYAPLVHARARRIVGDEANDVVQEVFMRLINNQPDEQKLLAWMYATTTNICLDRLRHLSRRGADWRSEVKASYEAGMQCRSGEELLLSNDLCRRVMANFDRKTQETALLVYYDEMTQEEAARFLGVSRRTVTERLRRLNEQATRLVQRWQTEKITSPTI